MTSIHRALEHRTRALVAVLALALAAAALAACGGGDDGGGGSSADAETLLEQTFTGTHKVESGKVDARLTLEADGDPSLRGPVKLNLSGPFQQMGDDKLPEFDLAVDVSAQGQSFEAGATSAGGKLYVAFGGTAYEAPADLMRQLQQSYAESQKQGSKNQMSFDALGIDPLEWLDDPTVAGEEDVAGTKTQHITAELDVDAFLDDIDGLLKQANDRGVAGAAGQEIPKSLSERDRSQIEGAVKQASIDVWTGDSDHTLRKLQVSVEIAPKDADVKSASIDFTVELSDLNEPQTIEAPKTTRPLQELLGQFSGLLGGALGGGSAGGAGGGSTAQLDKYTRCLEEAGNDVGKAQECAALLTK